MTTAAIIQSSYAPWKGYFDILHDADIFVFLDDVQFTNRDWRSRNRIKTQAGLKWLSVPVGSSQRRLINEVAISDPGWQKKHWNSILHAYGKAPFFKELSGRLENFYLDETWDSLSRMNQSLVRLLARDYLEIATPMLDSSELGVSGTKQDRLINILQEIGASRYISGPAARAYIDEEGFTKAGIELVWKDYDGYPVYDQLHEGFEHGVSVIDLLFNCGPASPWYIWGWRTDPDGIHG